MALGLPTVASACGANPEILREGTDGFLCDTPEDWTRRLAELLADPQLRARMGQAARARAEANYSVRRNAGRLAQIFRQVAAPAEQGAR
jgi:glycosyltransferase involved in cell wall biosynthesis